MMEGVILFADDKVFDNGSPENLLYLLLCKEFPVLAVDSLELADSAIKSIGTFSAIILDWEFVQKIAEGATKISNPTVLLDEANFYSLVYVFSNSTVSESIKSKYTKKFEKRIVFRKKNIGGKIATIARKNCNKIKKDIGDWQSKNQNQTIPQQWSNSINQSLQQIFSQLSKANQNWIIELHKSAGKDVNPEIEVLNLLQSLLLERIVTDVSLRDSIKYLADHPPAHLSNDGLAELFQKIYYTDLKKFNLTTAPIMTGDIFKLSSTKNPEYGIIVTPECDIKKVVGDASQKFQLLKFKRKDFVDYLANTYTGKVHPVILNKDQKKKAPGLFNQPIEKLYFLISFPFAQRVCDSAAVIDFSNSIEYLPYSKLTNKQRICKLNTPFVQQLRQRYLSYIGRVGVPTIPEALRTINLLHFFDKTT